MPLSYMCLPLMGLVVLIGFWNRDYISSTPARSIIRYIIRQYQKMFAFRDYRVCRYINWSFTAINVTHKKRDNDRQIKYWSACIFFFKIKTFLLSETVFFFFSIIKRHVLLFNRMCCMLTSTFCNSVTMFYITSCTVRNIGYILSCSLEIICSDHDHRTVLFPSL